METKAIIQLCTLIGILALILGILSAPQKQPTDPELIARAKVVLTRINKEYGEWKHKSAIAEWTHYTNVTEQNRMNVVNVSRQYTYWRRQMTAEVNAFPWREIDDYDITRQFKKLSIPGASALSLEKYAEYQEVLSQMVSTDGAGKECAKDDFIKYVELSNEMARLNNYTDMAAFLLRDYETHDFTDQIERLWQQLKPLYLHLHAYIRHKLRMSYYKNTVSNDGLIPILVLNLMNPEPPYPDKGSPDITNSMIKKNFNASMIFKIAENFFTSMNLSAMPDTFWQHSIFEKPDNVKLSCGPAALDFFDGKDFRISQCTEINRNNLLSTHHEMGHIQYYLQYKNQPAVYRKGANAGFQEAVGDTIALSVSTPEYLKEIGLLENTETDHEAMINHLYIIGCRIFFILTSSYSVDKWRWGVFQSQIPPDDYNCQWWKLIEEIQGTMPPSEPTEYDFDPGGIMHKIAEAAYIKYFVGSVLQFQFHKALCIEAGQYDPAYPNWKLLSQCNIYRSVEAGNLFKSMLELGSSRPWQDALEKITGQRKMDASALLEYFKPLQDWLKAENAKNHAFVGWETSGRNCRAQN